MTPSRQLITPRPRASRPNEAGLALSALLFGVPLLGLGIWMIITMGLLPILSWSDSQGWTETPGKIIEAKVSWNETKTRATVRPRYTYEVDGREFEGTRYDFGDHRFDPKELEAVLIPLREEKTISCYVNPDAPSESVLSQAYDGKFTGRCIFGGFFLLLGAALTWVGFRWHSVSARVGSISGD